MANNHGTAILNFSKSARSAVTKTEQVVSDTVPNPFDWGLKWCAPFASEFPQGLIYGGGSRWYMASNTNTLRISGNNGNTWSGGGNLSAAGAPWRGGWNGADLIILVCSGGTATHKVVASTGVITNGGALPSASAWSVPCWSPTAGLWVSILTGVAASTTYVTSPDGTTWTTRNTLGAKTYSGLSFDGNYFIAESNTSSQTFRSSDGLTWGGTDATGTTGIWAVQSNGAGLSLLIGSTDVIGWSTDGTTWNNLTVPGIGSPGAVRWTGTEFIVVLSGTTGRIARSSNCIDWTFQSINSYGRAWPMSGYGNERLILANTTDNYIMIADRPLHSDANTRTITNNVIEVEPAYANIGSNYASVTVTGQTELLATDNIDAWIQGTDSTADHNSIEHKIAPIKLSVTNIVPGVGFDIIGLSEYRLDGDFKVRWAWAT